MSIFSAETDKIEVTEKAIEKSVEKAVEKALQKATARIAKENAAKKKHKTKRPNKLEGPTTVHFFAFVVDINNINAAAQNFTANVFLCLRWKDARLAKFQR